jgi:hypothetical protein
MPDQIVDPTAAALQNGSVKRPCELPHGLLTVPDQVHGLLAQERARHPAEPFARTEDRLLHDWTLSYYFEAVGHEVLYRPTPQGPEVLAVGFDEIHNLTDGMNPAKMVGLKLWMP